MRQAQNKENIELFSAASGVRSGYRYAVNGGLLSRFGLYSHSVSNPKKEDDSLFDRCIISPDNNNKQSKKLDKEVKTIFIVDPKTADIPWSITSVGVLGNSQSEDLTVPGTDFSDVVKTMFALTGMDQSFGTAAVLSVQSFLESASGSIPEFSEFVPADYVCKLVTNSCETIELSGVRWTIRETGVSVSVSDRRQVSVRRYSPVLKQFHQLRNAAIRSMGPQVRIFQQQFAL